jgi:GNAT superfamily N-acetyltransferase
MKVRQRRYDAEQDFLRVRDFLAQTYGGSDKPLNWRIERWNYARYFVAPLLGDPDPVQSASNIQFWEDVVRVWENDAGEIVGVVNVEHPAPWHPGFGEAFLQRHPQYSFLLGEMLEYAEANLLNREKNLFHVYVFDHDRPFQELVRRRGYQKDAEQPEYDSEFVIAGDLPEYELPEGHVIRSMADGGDLARRSKVFGLGFNHPDPRDWPTVCTYAELQKAPDYRDDLDLCVVGADGEYVSFCLVWYDEVNRMGILEPVGTHPDFRRRGLARAVVMEGIRRAAALGADRVWVGSGQPFYEAVGFRKRYASYRWTKRATSGA